MARFVLVALAPDAVGVDHAAIADALRGAGATPGAHVAVEGALGLAVDCPVSGPLRARAVELRRAVAARVSCDLAVRPAGASVPPRLAVLDMDSTLITIEVIDELAGVHGVGAEVAAITERAMRGELDFEASLRARVGKLRGLPSAALDELAARLVLSDGAQALIDALHARGALVAIASGGFTFAAAALQTRLGLAHAHANQLELVDDALSGRVLGPVVTAERKAALVVELAAAAQIPLAYTLAIGDGANDRLMLAQAGFGVAFRAKPALAAMADATIDQGGLERVLGFLDQRLLTQIDPP